LLQRPFYGKAADPLLLKLLESPDKELRYHAVRAVYECRDPKLAPFVAKFAGDDEARFRVAAAYMAKNLLDESFKAVRTQLLPLLGDKDESVRFEALRGFALKRDPAAGPVILEALRREQFDEGVKIHVMQALDALTGKTFGYDMHNWGPASEGNREAIVEFEKWLKDPVIERVPWGEATDGLRAHLFLPKESFAAGEPMPCTLQVQNVSDRDIPLWSYVYVDDHGALRLTDPAGRPVRLEQGVEYRRLARRKQPLILKPNEVHELTADIRRVHRSWIPKDKQRTYQMKWAHPHGLAVGRKDALRYVKVTSNTVTVSVYPEESGEAGESTADGAAVAEPDWSKLAPGLNGRLVVGKPTIRSNEQFNLSLELCNNHYGGGPWMAVQEGNPFLFEARVTDADGKAIRPTMQRADVLYSPKWRVIRPFPDERLTIPLSIRSIDGARGSHFDTATNIWKLPPGKYKISGTFASPKEFRYRGEGTPWVGTLELPPIKVEIVADDQEKPSDWGEGGDKEEAGDSDADEESAKVTSAGGETPSIRADTLTLRIEKSAEMISMNLGGRRISLDELRHAMENAVQEESAIPLIIRADRAVPHSTVVAAIEAAKAAGVKRVQISHRQWSASVSK
jgi:biopolymer transport protein ExbD